MRVRRNLKTTLSHEHKSGTKLLVKQRIKGVYSNYNAMVLESRQRNNRIEHLVHYIGWNKRHDEWIPRKNILRVLSLPKHLGIKSNKKNKTISQTLKKPFDEKDIIPECSNEAATNAADNNTVKLDQTVLIKCTKIPDEFNLNAHFNFNNSFPIYNDSNMETSLLPAICYDKTSIEDSENTIDNIETSLSFNNNYHHKENIAVIKSKTCSIYKTVRKCFNNCVICTSNKCFCETNIECRCSYINKCDILHPSAPDLKYSLENENNLMDPTLDKIKNSEYSYTCLNNFKHCSNNLDTDTLAENQNLDNLKENLICPPIMEQEDLTIGGGSIHSDSNYFSDHCSTTSDPCVMFNGGTETTGVTNADNKGKLKKPPRAKPDILCQKFTYSDITGLENLTSDERIEIFTERISQLRKSYRKLASFLHQQKKKSKRRKEMTSSTTQKTCESKKKESKQNISIENNPDGYLSDFEKNNQAAKCNIFDKSSTVCAEELIQSNPLLKKNYVASKNLDPNKHEITQPNLNSVNNENKSLGINNYRKVALSLDANIVESHLKHSFRLRTKPKKLNDYS